MDYSVADFYASYREELTLLAGESGLGAAVTEVGILDYEFLPEMKGRYFHANFRAGNLFLTTFLYLRDSPFLISDAIRELIAAGCCGLVIKNIFRLKIPDSALRYADSRGFPIFEVTSADFMIDRVIHRVLSGIELRQSAEAARAVIDRVLSRDGGPDGAERELRRLNPSFADQHAAMYIPDLFAAGAAPDAVNEAVRGTVWDTPECLCAGYRGGLLALCSGNRRFERVKSEAARVLLERTRAFGDFPVGVSDTHYYIGEAPDSIRESYYAALAGKKARSGTVVAYGDIGLYQILMPCASEKALSGFSRRLIEPIEHYDIETKSSIADTLAAYFEHHYSIAETCAALDQHYNTVRYRLEKLSAILGLDYRNAGDISQLILAFAIRDCQALLKDGWPL